MAVRKISVSLSAEALAVIDEACAREGFTRSGWMERAAQQASRRRALAEAVALWEREHGPFDSAELAAADADLEAALSRPEPPARAANE